MIVAQAVTLDKFVNSYHFAEVVDVIYVMNLQDLVYNTNAIIHQQNQNNTNSIRDFKEISIVMEETLDMLRETYDKRVNREKVWKFYSNNDKEDDEISGKFKAKIKKVLKI